MENVTMKRKLLWMSAAVPYDTVPHAGGKNENFYLKEIARRNMFDIRLASFCKPDELEKIDLEQYGIKYDVYVRPRGGIINEAKRGIAWLSKSLIYNKYAGLVPIDLQVGMKELLSNLVSENYNPDIIIMQWTEILFFLPLLKKHWLYAKFVSIEEDVSYLGIERKKNYYVDIFRKKFFMIKKERVKKIEIEYLNDCDLVILNNIKDYNLIKKDGVKSEAKVCAVYYQNLSTYKLMNQGAKDIVFYGAMGREENWKSAIWFIDNVMPLLKNLPVRFVIVGGGVRKKLLGYKSDKVIIKGFVEDVGLELSNAMCLVAPLVLGAGVKVKILEALSLGVPVLTNNIGIEGIPAIDKKDFFYCEKPSEYVDIILQILNSEINMKEVSESAKKMILDNFNYERNADELNQLLCKL